MSKRNKNSEPEKINIPDKPERINEFVIRRVDGKNHEPEYYLKNQNYDVYLVLNVYDYFIWNLLDGSNAIDIINKKFYKEFNRFSIEYVKKKLELFCTRGFINNYADFNPKTLNKRIKFLQFRFPVKKIDVLFNLLYKIIGKYLFSRIFKIFFTIICITGLIAFYFIRDKAVHFIFDKTLINVIVAYAAFLLPVIIHEFSHALACIHYGCEVKEAGIMIYLCFPVFYVNTSDSWMVRRKARIIISLAGIIADLFVCCLLSLMYFFFPGAYYAPLIYQVIFIGFVRILLNLNPLLAWDGYYVLMDLLNIHNLRSQAFNFLKSTLFSKIRKKESFSLTDWKLLIYAIASVIYMGYFILLNRLTHLYELIFINHFNGIKLFDIISIFFMAQLLFFIIYKPFQAIKNLVTRKKRSAK